MRKSCSDNKNHLIKLLLIVVAVAVLHVLLIGGAFHKSEKIHSPGQGPPVTVEGTGLPGDTPGDRGLQPAVPKPPAPNMTLDGYGIDPYIQQLRLRHLPESFFRVPGPPDMERDYNHLAGVLKKDPDNTEVLYLAGWNCLMREDYDNFFIHVDRLVSLEPENPRNLQMMANARYKMGEYTRSIKWAKKALKYQPDDGFTHYLLGSSYLLHNNDAPRAIPVLERAIELNPELPFAYGSLGQCYFEIGGPGNIEKGLEIFTRGIERFPDHQLTFVLMAEDYLYNTGDLDRTIQLTNRIIELDPDNFQAYLMEGALLMDMGRYSDAEEAFRKGMEAGPQYKFLSEIQVTLGQALYHQGKLEEARQHFQKAVEIQEQNPENNLYRSDAYVGLAMIHMEQENFSEADKSLDRAMVAFPDNLNHVIARVEWYLRSSDPQGAEKFLKTMEAGTGRRLFLRDVLVEFLRAKISASIRDDEKAREHLLKSIRTAPDYVKKIVDQKARKDLHTGRLFDGGEFDKTFERIKRHRSRNHARLIRYGTGDDH